MRKLGQHFLRNPRIAEKIVAALALTSGDTVIEIGPGHGELTAPLARACADAGASLRVIEKDARLAEDLRRRSSGLAIEVISGDALAALPSMMELHGASPHALKLTGNLPYYITGKLLRVISDSPQPPARAVFMVQREVAERIVAAPPRMNRLAASVQFWAEAKIVASVPREDFSPPPKVESAVIALAGRPLPWGTLPAERYYEAVRAIFAQPRKTLVNNISAAKKEPVSKEEIASKIAAFGIDPSLRPQDLTIGNIAGIAEVFWG